MSISKLHIFILGFLAVPGLMAANPLMAGQDSWMTRAKNYFSSWFKKDSADAPRAVQPEITVKPPIQSPAPIGKPIPSESLKKYPTTPMPWDKKTVEQTGTFAPLKKVIPMAAGLEIYSDYTKAMAPIIQKFQIRIMQEGLNKEEKDMTPEELQKWNQLKREFEAEQKSAFDFDDAARSATRGIITHVPGYASILAGAAWSKERYGSDYVSWMSPTLCEFSAKTIMAAGWNDKKYRMRTKEIVTGLGTDAVIAGLGYYAAQKLPSSVVQTFSNEDQPGWMPWLARTVALNVAMPIVRHYIKTNVVNPVMKSVAKSLNYPAILGYKKPKPKIKKSRMPQQTGGQEIDGVYYSPADMAKIEHFGNAMARQYQQQMEQQALAQPARAG